jgi:hypothetical protein
VLTDILAFVPEKESSVFMVDATLCTLGIGNGLARSSYSLASAATAYPSLRLTRQLSTQLLHLFLKLFAMKDSGHIIRFMSDCPTLADYAAIVSALPAGPFLREMPRGLTVSSRRSIKGRAAG